MGLQQNSCSINPEVMIPCSQTSSPFFFRKRKRFKRPGRSSLELPSPPVSRRELFERRDFHGVWGVWESIKSKNLLQPRSLDGEGIYFYKELLKIYNIFSLCADKRIWLQTYCHFPDKETEKSGEGTLPKVIQLISSKTRLPGNSAFLNPSPVLSALYFRRWVSWSLYQWTARETFIKGDVTMP